MRTVGQILRDARLSKNYSRASLEKKTRIRRDFIEKIENQDWEGLPEYAVVLGFVKSMAGVLGLNVAEVTALLRRDYPPKVIKINPKPDVGDKFTWTPKLTFITGVSLMILVFLGYLVFQFVKFNSPPFLEVDSPQSGMEVVKKTLVVSGRTDPDAVVRVNNQPVIAGPDGKFETEIEVAESTRQIEVKAVSRSGKETVVKRDIRVELKE